MSQMIPLRIQDKADANTPLFPEFLAAMPHESEHSVEIVGIGLLQGGMQNGKPSVGILVRVTTLEGSMVMCAQCSAAMYLTLAAGMKGAMARWGTPWDGA